MGNVFKISCDPCLSCGLDCVKREAAYIRELKEKLHALQIQGQTLSDAWTDLRRRVEDAEERTINRKRTEPVGGWLSHAKAAVDQANELLGDGPKEIGRLCLGGYCSTNCMASHKFGKQVHQNLKDVIALIGQCNFVELVETYLESVAELQDKLHSLQIERQRLSDAWTDLKRRVEDAEQRTINQKRREPVGGWLLRAEAAVAKADELIRDSPQEINRLLHGGHSPTNSMASHNFRKKVDQNLTDVIALIGQCNFEELVETYLESVAELEVKLHSLQIESQRLSEEWTDLKRRVEDAELRMMNMKRREPVGGWLLRAEAAVAKANELIRDSPQEIERLCLAGHSPTNSMASHKFGKEVDQNLTDVKDLIGQSKFEVLVERDLESIADERPAEPHVVGLESTLEKVWRCLVEEPAGIVGLYGMGGVGKTTLLTQINNKFLNEANNFDCVIWVVVSKDQRLEKIQETIVEKIGPIDDLWKNKSVEEKAPHIFRILKNKKFVLLLDDIWEWVDLTKVGVPLPSSQNSIPNSKIVFTTRIANVCGSMGAKGFEVECLSIEQAWELFQKKVGEETLNSHPDILELAQLVAKECGGLPLALITIGRAMAYKKTPAEWRYAINVLRRSASEFAGLGKEVYPLLKFSYDSLPNDAIRSCFSYCCLYPEDYKIRKSELIDCWTCEGFLDESDGFGARDQGDFILGTLVQACLLEEEDGRLDGYVKMHDVIRDMALWITCEIERKKEGFMVRAGAGLTKAPDVGSWENVKRLSLMRNRIKKLPEIPNCPHLLTLFLDNNYALEMFADGFFQSMTSIKVLKMSSNYSLRKLPLEISKLVALQLLDISWTYIQELPEELKVLENLKCLNLEGTSELATIPRQLICSFSKLRVLRMFGVGMRGLSEESNVLFGGGEVLVQELRSLKNLEALDLKLRSFNALQILLRSDKLRSCTQALELKYFGDSTQLDVSRLADMKHLNTLNFEEFSAMEDLQIDYTRELQNTRQPYIFHSLHKIEVWACYKLKDLTFLVLAPNLKDIEVAHCHAMEKIINVEKFADPEMIENKNPFAKLKFLKLDWLKNLNSIYWKPLPFPHLMELRILGCYKLRKLPLDSDSARGHKIVIQGEEDWIGSVEWEDEATKNTFLPCFQVY